MLEPIQGEGGVLPSPPGYLEAVRALCDEREALLVIDEVQTGLGRTGKWFGFQHAAGVTPDIVSMAKALGNGVPIGACWARDDVAAAFKPGDHATTYGGQPLAARAALTVLEVMEQIDAPASANRAGARLAEGLAATPGVAAVRGAGLILGAELDAAARGTAGRARAVARRPRRQRGHPDRPAFRAVAARHRRRDRRRGRAGAQGPAGGCRMKPRHFLEVDDLEEVTRASCGILLQSLCISSSVTRSDIKTEGSRVSALTTRPASDRTSETTVPRAARRAARREDPHCSHAGRCRHHEPRPTGTAHAGGVDPAPSPRAPSAGRAPRAVGLRRWWRGRRGAANGPRLAPSRLRWARRTNAPQC